MALRARYQTINLHLYLSVVLLYRLEGGGSREGVLRVPLHTSRNFNDNYRSQEHSSYMLGLESEGKDYSLLCKRWTSSHLAGKGSCDPPSPSFRVRACSVQSSQARARSSQSLMCAVYALGTLRSSLPNTNTNL